MIIPIKKKRSSIFGYLVKTGLRVVIFKFRCKSKKINTLKFMPYLILFFIRSKYSYYSLINFGYFLSLQRKNRNTSTSISLSNHTGRLFQTLQEYLLNAVKYQMMVLSLKKK